jgi:protein-S-isoprenylcysteine O-methyltransferase Ste14
MLNRVNRKSFADFLFKYRSYTPVPFIIILFIFENANTASIITGALAVLAGEILRLWGVSWVGSETRTTGCYAGTYLIISGPYAFVRNPLYMGNIIIYMGAGIMSFAVFPYIQLTGLIFFFLQYYFIVKEEEKFLLQKYGDQYREYLKNVPGFIPRLTPYRNRNIEQPGFNLAAGFRSEKRTLQAIGVVSLVIFILWFV